MKAGTKAYIAREGGKILSDAIRLVMSKPKKLSAGPESPKEEASGEVATQTIQERVEAPEKSQEAPTATTRAQELETGAQQDVATACVVCALGHFSTSAGLLNEAVRFKAEGITSNEILDRMAKVLEEQNALERVDLTPEKLQRTPEWEREIAEEALQESRKLRHRLEGTTSVEELEQAAAETAAYYRKMNRAWYQGRFRHLGKEKVEAIEKRISSEDKERVLKRAEEIIEEV